VYGDRCTRRQLAGDLEIDIEAGLVLLGANVVGLLLVRRDHRRWLFGVLCPRGNRIVGAGGHE